MYCSLFILISRSAPASAVITRVIVRGKPSHRADTLTMVYCKIMNTIVPVVVYITTILRQMHSGTFFLQGGVIVIVIPLIIRSFVLERAARDGTVPSM